MTFEYKKFQEIDLNDTFFSSLRDDYVDFDKWFNSKKNSTAYVSYGENRKITGFLYYKIENEELLDMTPPFSAKRRLKIGTFKVIPRGTKLGENFIRKSLNFAIQENVDEVYITIYDKHVYLIKLLNQFGFEKKSIKNTLTKNGQEGVYFKIIK